MGQYNLNTIAERHLIPKFIGMLTCCIALLELIGVILHLPLLNDHVVKEFATFTLCGIILIISAYQSKSIFIKLIKTILIAVILLVGVVGLLEQPIFHISIFSNNFYATMISLPTSICLILISIALLIENPFLTQVIAIFIAMDALYYIVAYLLGYGNFIHHIDNDSHTTASTSMFFFIYGIGIFFLNNTYGLAKLYLSPYSGGVLVRRILPFIIIIPIGITYLRNSVQWAGLYSVEYGVVLLVFVIITLLISLTVYFAYQINELDFAHRKNEQFLQSVLDHTANIIFIKDIHGRYLLINKQYENLIQINNAEIRGKTDAEIFPKEYAKQFILNDQKVITEKKPLLVEEIALIQNEKHVYLANKFPIFDRNKNVSAIAGVAIDVSTQKKQEQELFLLNEKLSAIMNSSNHLIISTDLNGIIQVFNPAAETTLGYKADEIIGLKTPLFLHEPEEIKKRANELTKLLGKTVAPGFEIFIAQLTTQEVEEREWTYIRKNGTKLPIFLSVSALHDSNNKPIGYLGIGKDVTEQKKIDTIKNEFISIVSHELRTPLTSIQGALDLLENICDKTADTESLFSIAKKNSERLIRLINDILDIEKIKSGKIQFSLKPLPITSFVGEAAILNQQYAEKFGVEIKLDKAQTEGIVNVDKDKLLQVLTNLISNAVKFSPPGETVTINLSQSGNNVRVSISDKGAGIPENFKSQVFQPFAQADTSMERTKGGTGLGLSISKAIIEKMGGTIGFKSVLHKGTTFYFELPLVKGMQYDTSSTK